MATLYFVKRGVSALGEQDTHPFHVELPKISGTFPSLKPTFLGTDIPTFDAQHVTSGVEGYRVVLVEVEAHELQLPFGKAGFYALEVNPLEAKAKLGLGE